MHPDFPATREILDAPATAELLRLDVRHVQRMASQGKLPGRRVGRKWLFFRDELEALLDRSTPSAPRSETPVRPSELSARNRLRGTVRSIRIEGLMAEVILELGATSGDGQQIVAVITRSSVERLGLRVGDSASAVMKSTEVMIARD